MSLRDLPIRRKLTLLSMLTSGVALALACTAFVIYAQVDFRRSMVRDLSIITGMIGYNSASALSFDDAQSATETLEGMRAAPHVLRACIYRKSGEVFAMYHRPGQPEVAWPKMELGGSAFRGERLEMFEAIAQDGSPLGAIYLQADLSPLRALRKRYIVIACVVMLVAAAIAYLITARAQRFISDPLSHIASIARVVARERNYAVRAVKQGDDELGHLIDGFNDMLTEIQTRDAELQQSRDRLEKRVEERTAELRHAQEESAEHAAQLRFIFEAVPCGVSWVRNGTNEHLVNEGFFRISGLRPEQLTNYESVRAITHPDDLKRQDVLRAKLERGETDDILLEKRYLRPNGGVAWAVLSIKVFRGPDGKIAQEVSTIVDITERKEAEAERERAQRQLLEVSRRAGMAEVATGVLHNVGNVLNSVNVAATVIIDEVRVSKVGNLTKLATLLQENAATLGDFITVDPRGRRIPGYIATLATELTQERSAITRELEHLRKHIEHIKEIVAMQQSYAKVSGVAETLPLVELVEDALRMNAGSLVRHGLEVERDYAAEPVVTVERHKVLQILVNLIRNAKYACDDSNRTDKRLTVRITQDLACVRISVIDNGVGIPAENLTRIFAHGFTTRKEGHGFGLHSGALVARELGGSLTAMSDGPDTGATFTLEIPCVPEPALV